MCVCHVHAKADIIGAAVDNCWWTGPHGREMSKSNFCGDVALRVLEVRVGHEAQNWMSLPNCRRFSPMQCVLKQVITVPAKDSPSR